MERLPCCVTDFRTNHFGCSRKDLAANFQIEMAGDICRGFDFAESTSSRVAAFCPRAMFSPGQTIDRRVASNSKQPRSKRSAIIALNPLRYRNGDGGRHFLHNVISIRSLQAESSSRTVNDSILTARGIFSIRKTHLLEESFTTNRRDLKMILNPATGERGTRVP
jgi:hypothetical protein